MRNRILIFALWAVAAIEAFAVFGHGGTVLNQWYMCLLGIALISVAYWFTASRDAMAPPLDHWLRWLVLLLPCYAAFQIIPLPEWLLRILSPDRAALLSALQRIIPGTNYAPLSVVPGAGLRHIIQISGYAVVFLLLRELGFRLRDRPWFLIAPVLVIGFAEAVIGALQYVSNAPVTGTYVNRNHYAGLLEMIFPFAAVYCFAGARQLWSGDPSTARALKFAAGGIVLAAILAAIVSSLSRGGFVASVLALLTIAMVSLDTRRTRGVKRWAAMGTAFALILSFVFFTASEPLVDRFQVSSPATDTRPLLWKETLHLIAAYPIVGCGLGGYESAFLKYKNVEPMLAADFAHNDYLQLLAEMGLIGFLIGAILFGTIFVRSIRAARHYPEPDGRLVALGCTGALAAIAFHSFVDFNMYIPANTLLLAWICGVAASLTIEYPPPEALSARSTNPIR